MFCKPIKCFIVLSIADIVLLIRRINNTILFVYYFWLCGLWDKTAYECRVLSCKKYLNVDMPRNYLAVILPDLCHTKMLILLLQIFKLWKTYVRPYCWATIGRLYYILSFYLGSIWHIYMYVYICPPFSVYIFFCQIPPQFCSIWSDNFMRCWRKKFTLQGTLEIRIRRILYIYIYIYIGELPSVRRRLWVEVIQKLIAINAHQTTMLRHYLLCTRTVRNPFMCRWKWEGIKLHKLFTKLTYYLHSRTYTI